MILNFGHTIGHALESSTGYRKFVHGEAVAVGMIAAAHIAEELKILDQEAVERIVNLLGKLGLPTAVSGISCRRISSSLIKDKKVRQGKVNFVLPERIGRVTVRNNVPLSVIRQALKKAGCR
ncbi:MAG: 3-dehydroquinate synthase, partial [Candidatus Margulisbacteria bacterium]|nr:3-dehydroquinate synthase [Candidatus Margulisiibacteriota bacterium]